MQALRLISIYIFNGISRVAHKQRNLNGEPFQIPYPSYYLKKQSSNVLQKQMINVSKKRIKNDNEEHFSSSKNELDAENANKIWRNTAFTDHGKNPTIIETKNETAIELLIDNLKLKKFIMALEDETIKLMEPVEEGIKVPRPLPYPLYLNKPPEIPISETYTTVLRRLHQEKKLSYARSKRDREIKIFPKKPPVAKYYSKDIVEEKQNAVRLILKSKFEENGDATNLVSSFWRRKNKSRGTSNTLKERKCKNKI